MPRLPVMTDSRHTIKLVVKGDKGLARAEAEMRGLTVHKVLKGPKALRNMTVFEVVATGEAWKAITKWYNDPAGRVRSAEHGGAPLGSLLSYPGCDNSLRGYSHGDSLMDASAGQLWRRNSGT